MKNLDLTEIRHSLHRLAEPSGYEVETHKFIVSLLNDFHPTAIHTFENSQNILAVFDSGQSGETLLFRGDFDAVRVDETIAVPYASSTPGVAHKCGHDGHATVLLGLAERLHQSPITRGRVLLFFQAAEETGEGAGKLLETNILEKIRPDMVFAFHNIPGEPLGTVICRPDSFTCSVVSCDIELHGSTSHASEPLKAVCPYEVAKVITDRLLALNRYDMRQEDFCLVTLVEFRIGEQAYGVTAGHGVLRFTLRAKDDALLQKTKTVVQNVVAEVISTESRITSRISWKEYFAASKNHAGAVQRLQRAAERCGLAYKEKEVPFSWGEDFGLLTQHFDGALFGIGSGEGHPSLHNQQFDFPDAILPVGVALFRELCECGA